MDRPQYMTEIFLPSDYSTISKTNGDHRCHRMLWVTMGQRKRHKKCVLDFRTTVLLHSSILGCFFGSRVRLTPPKLPGNQTWQWKTRIFLTRRRRQSNDINGVFPMFFSSLIAEIHKLADTLYTRYVYIIYIYIHYRYNI